MTSHRSLCEHMLSLQQALQQSGQRRIVALCGSAASCFAAIVKLKDALVLDKPLLISDPKISISPAHSNAESAVDAFSVTPADQLKHYLGQEVSCIFWDGFAGINPDALGIASGLIKGGGLLFLLLPELAQLSRRADPDYLRMCADQADLDKCQTFFLQRLVAHLQADPDIIHYPADTPEQFSFQTPALPAASPRSLPTDDQLAALAAIQRVAKGHRYRPLVIQADRGRGKSSALGLAAAQLYIAYGFKLALSAPDKRTCQQALRHYENELAEQIADPVQRQAGLSAFQFLPLDQLAEQCEQFHMVLIDEAAAVPVPILSALLKCHPRLVFATTLHGYEGHGQGFTIRFKEALDQHAPEWKAIYLRTPIRWQTDDSVERWFFRLLLLNAAPSLQTPGAAVASEAASNTLVANTRSALVEGTHSTGTSYQISWLTQAELAEDETLLEAVFSLLVSAHYQTKPSDLRLILDHPQVHIAVATASPHATDTIPPLVGVLLILEEGGLPEELAEAIIAGTRRPRGHLLPQALCASTGMAEFLRQRSYRITRIAVASAARQQGIGSALLHAARALAEQQGIDSLSTSFGLRPELLSFWRKNHFEILKLGLHADGASGTQSLMMMSALSEPAKALARTAAKRFADYFLFNLPRQFRTLSCDECLAILKCLAILECMTTPRNLNLPGTETLESSTRARGILEAFAYAHRAFEDSALELYVLILDSVALPCWSKLETSAVNLLIMRVLQGQDTDRCCKLLGLKGKKELDLSLRKAVQVLLES